MNVDDLVAYAADHPAAAVRIAYALGFCHADNGADPDLPEADPAWAIVESERLPA